MLGLLIKERERERERESSEGGGQGATLGIIEYLSQSNGNSKYVNAEDRLKFIDDLKILDIVNLLTIGMMSYNIKEHVASDIPDHGQFIPPQKLQSQDWLQQINK